MAAAARGQAPGPIRTLSHERGRRKGLGDVDGKLLYEPVRFANLPQWREDDAAAAMRAFVRSAVQVIDRGPVVPAAWGGAKCDVSAACRIALNRGGRSTRRGEARAFFEHFFEPFRVVDDSGPGLLTGYFEPVLFGSLTKAGRFRVPIYRRPPDLVTVVAEDQRGRQGVGLTHMRKRQDGALEAYHTRAEIEAEALAGQGLELCWLEDPVDAFFLHVQGSGIVRLADGGRLRLTYDGKNGHPYTSIGRHLIERGVIDARAMSLDSLGRYLRADETRGRKAMQVNASYVFFRAMCGREREYARGALDAPLTPGRSLAVDASVHPLGVPVFVDAPTLRHAQSGRPFQRLMIAQDVGSAICGQQRGDVFVGSGRQAGVFAGAVKHSCRFFVLLPRRRERSTGAGPITP